MSRERLMTASAERGVRSGTYTGTSGLRAPVLLMSLIHIGHGGTVNKFSLVGPFIDEIGNAVKATSAVLLRRANRISSRSKK